MKTHTKEKLGMALLVIVGMPAGLIGAAICVWVSGLAISEASFVTPEFVMARYTVFPLMGFIFGFGLVWVIGDKIERRLRGWK